MIDEGGMMAFDWNILSGVDLAMAKRYVPDLRVPDLVIDGDDGKPYLWRWHVVPRSNEGGNVYFHIQTADDPSRPLHDHPWDNQSVILAGGYREIVMVPGTQATLAHFRKKGAVVQRIAQSAHRLELLKGVPYAMTQFSTGPKLQGWGFYIEGQKVPYQECCRFEGNRTIFSYPERFKHLENAA